ncbi:hypothetical protein I7I53_09453 [Histoplasma capsulatum var. duboisii H88]|uniref:Uncharacterized protein n=1 Tax=Ajellomyces capsulatus (strain H88) TaxID=544711 RepID=A0A8A1L4Z8_AJEC8|nr:hypothetical protein I7I53_09453 [Histoplasma capsulatum var. duboisii H88]
MRQRMGERPHLVRVPTPDMVEGGIVMLGDSRDCRLDSAQAGRLVCGDTGSSISWQVFKVIETIIIVTIIIIISRPALL